MRFDAGVRDKAYAEPAVLRGDEACVPAENDALNKGVFCGTDGLGEVAEEVTCA